MDSGRLREKNIPELIGIDMTLWPFHVDNCKFPFSKDREGNIKDDSDFHVQLYPETLKVIENLYLQKINLAIASRIENIALAYQLLHLLDLRKYFICIEIYPTRKTLHFTQIQKKTGLPFRDMLFYDDDVRNLKCIEKLGVRVFQVIDGINKKLILKSIHKS